MPRACRSRVHHHESGSRENEVGGSIATTNANQRSEDGGEKELTSST